MKLIYVSVLPQDDFETALLRVKMASDYMSARPRGLPYKLMGNSKILELVSSNLAILIKVDGPGFIIDELYKELSK